MKNILKKDFFITYKSKYWWILLIIVAIFVSLFTTIKYNQSSFFADNGMSNVADNSYVVGQTNNTVFSYIETMICSDVLIMFSSIFTVMIVLQDFQNGFIKNIWISIDKKYNYIFSKLVIIALFVLTTFLLTILIVFMLDKFFFKFDQIGNFNNFFSMLLKQFFLHTAFLSLIILISIVFRKVLVVVIATIVYLAFGQPLLYSAINLLVNKLFKFTENFEIEKYLLFGNIERTRMAVSEADSIRAILIATVCLFMSQIFAYWFIKNKDII